MPDLDRITVTEISSTEVDETIDLSLPVIDLVAEEEMDVVVVKFVLDSVIDFLEDLKLSGELLKHGGQLLRDVEALRQAL